MLALQPAPQVSLTILPAVAGLFPKFIPMTLCESSNTESEVWHIIVHLNWVEYEISNFFVIWGTTMQSSSTNFIGDIQ